VARPRWPRQVVDQDFIRVSSSEPPRPVGQFVARNRHQDRNRLTLGIVASHRPMQGQQHILHEIVAIGRLQNAMPGPQQTLRQGHDLPNEPRVGGAVAALRGAHQG
jgi:hypothetical protein